MVKRMVARVERMIGKGGENKWQGWRELVALVERIGGEGGEN